MLESYYIGLTEGEIERWCPNRKNSTGNDQLSVRSQARHNKIYALVCLLEDVFFYDLYLGYVFTKLNY